MRQTDRRHLAILAAIAAIAVVGYGLMHVLVYIFPTEQDTTISNIILTLLIIGLGLAIPYWMLKLGFFEAHRRNPEERELHLQDLPKDEEDLEKDQRRKV